MNLIIDVIKKTYKGCFCCLIGTGSLLLLDANVFATSAGSNVSSDFRYCIYEQMANYDEIPEEDNLILMRACIDLEIEKIKQENIKIFNSFLTPDDKLYEILINKLLTFMHDPEGEHSGLIFVGDFLNYYSLESDRSRDLSIEMKGFIDVLQRVHESYKNLFLQDKVR